MAITSGSGRLEGDLDFILCRVHNSADPSLRCGAVPMGGIHNSNYACMHLENWERGGQACFR